MSGNLKTHAVGGKMNLEYAGPIMDLLALDTIKSECGFSANFLQIWQKLPEICHKDRNDFGNFA